MDAVDGQRSMKQWREVEEEMVEVLLQGKAPWGFTLKGGTEHREPLVITKVEEGSVAAGVGLQAGDQMVIVNTVALSGSRQQAISLVKTCPKTLTLVVRSEVKMVDVVSPHMMPSETEVHVARSFLTKILRSSMRKNDPVSRPHSWHSSKLTEEDPEPAAKDASSVPVWKPKHEVRLKESSSQDDQNNQHQLSSYLSSVKTMERLECPPHPYSPERMSPTKYISSFEPICGSGGKRDPSTSCLSSSSPPGPETSCRKGTDSENIFFNLSSKLGERSRYLQPTLGNGGWEGVRVEEQPTSQVSGGFRPNVGPVWQVPEKKKSQSPPPLPPLRSDSFAATKVFPYSEIPAKSHSRSIEQLTENNDQDDLRNHQEKTSESRCSFNPLPTKDLLHPTTVADHNQLHPNKHFSLSSNDIRQSHFVHQPAHQRQYSDESSLYLQIRSAPSSKSQSVGSYYRSLQDLPTNASSRKQVRQSMASVVASSGNPNPENGGHNRYYGLGSKHMSQTSEHQAKAEVCRGETEKPLWLNSNESGFPIPFKTNLKAKYSLPQSQVPYGENKERNGHFHLGNGVHYDPQTSEHSARTRSPEDGTKRGEGQSNDTKWHFPAHQNNDHKVSLQRYQDPWVPHEDHRITPLKTPLLHCLAQENRTLANRQSAAITSGLMSTHETCDSMASSSGKVNRRSDRYATTLRNEIQQKRAQLQKSRSAATLTCDADEEELEEWRTTETSTSSSVSFSNTYKDHLKEAQARVLQATSFQRRDLEPFSPDTQVVKSSTGRVRGRKRVPLAKRTHSFSEPDKIDKVGVEGGHQRGSFGEQRKLFEAKPAFSKPVSKSSQGEIEKIKDRAPSGDYEEVHPSVAPSFLSPGQKQISLDQQRLGTFAEYQATWNKQKKSSEVKPQGRYHSAENILDAGTEDKAVCIHERSRSSPSADFYTMNNSSSWRDQVQQSSYTPRGPLQPDHRTRPDAAEPSCITAPPGPSPGSQPPHTRALPSPPRPNLGPETTSSSQEFLRGAQPLSTSSSDTQCHASVKNPAAHGEMSTPDMSRQDSEPEDEKQQLPPSTSWTTTLAPPPPTGQPRPHSPQFAPLRLTDKPPTVATQEAPPRSDHVSNGMDVNGPLRKVPVRIIHTDTSSNWTYLPQNYEVRAESPPPPVIPPQVATEFSASSPFSSYAHQRGAEGTAPSGLTWSEDDKREELARDIMGKDKSLVDILDQTGRKTTMDLMEGLFPPEEQILEGAQQRRRASAGSRPPPSPGPSNRLDKDDVSTTATASLVPSSSYYNTSAPKAELLMKMKDMQEQLEEQDSEDELDVDLASKKQQLISSLARKLAVLRDARQSLQEDVEDNEALGRHVDATVQRCCQPNQLDKFRMFVGDLDKVVSLLLSLSGRLARVENALDSLEDEAPPLEKRTLIEKRKLLMRQHEDAKELKENLDRREHLVSGIMETHLDAESLDDYRHFVKMKSALIIEQRKLEDKIKLGEEQLKCLVDSLPLDQRPPT